MYSNDNLNDKYKLCPTTYKTKGSHTHKGIPENLSGIP